jgi:hypothetical protein
MIVIDGLTIATDLISMIVSFILITIIAYITLLIIDKGLPEIDFGTIKNDPKAEAIAGFGWLIIYALAFAGSLVSPFSLDGAIVREIVWVFVMMMAASILTIIAVRFISPFMPYCGRDGLKSISGDPVATGIFYLGSCVLIGILTYTALEA